MRLKRDHTIIIRQKWSRSSECPNKDFRRSKTEDGRLEICRSREASWVMAYRMGSLMPRGTVSIYWWRLFDMCKWRHRCLSRNSSDAKLPALISDNAWPTGIGWLKSYCWLCQRGVCAICMPRNTVVAFYVAIICDFPNDSSSVWVAGGSVINPQLELPSWPGFVPPSFFCIWHTHT